MASGAMVFLTLVVPAFGQRRVDGAPAIRPNATASDASLLQWFMSNNALPRTNMPGGNPAGGGAAGATVSVDSLKIPVAAAREMLEFHKKFEAGKLEDAQKHAEKAIKIYPNWASAHHNLGQVLAKQHQYERAASEFEAAGALDSGSALPWVSLAGVHLLQKEYSEGEEASRKALEIEPANITAKYFLGRTMTLGGKDTPEAVEMLRASQDQFPAARLTLSNIYLKRNDNEGAVRELRAYLAQPNAPEKEKVECIVQHITEPAKATCSMQ
jgi:tetratricopeptide (TPR) repeat protein